MNGVHSKAMSISLAIATLGSGVAMIGAWTHSEKWLNLGMRGLLVGSAMLVLTLWYYSDEKK